jgi:hypothetical protein
LVSSLTQMNPVRSIPSFFLKIHFNILIYAKFLQATSSLMVFLPNFCMHFSFPHACHMPCSSDLSFFDYPSNIGWEVKILKLIITYFSPFFSPLGPNIFSPDILYLYHFLDVRCPVYTKITTLYQIPM